MNWVIFSIKDFAEEFVLRSRRASPLINPPSVVTSSMPLSQRISNYCKIRLQRSSLTCPASPLQRKPLKHLAGKPSQYAGFSIVVFLFINMLMN